MKDKLFQKIITNDYIIIYKNDYIFYLLNLDHY